MKNIKEQYIQKLKSPGFTDHKFNFTRRELIKLGLLAAGGAVIPLTPLERAFAAMTAPQIPFLVFDLAGGASMTGNFLAGKEGGSEDLCENYRAHGWNPRASGVIDKTFGIPMYTQGNFLVGMKSALPAHITNPSQNYLKMSSICHFSLDDTSTNKSSAITLVSKAGLKGKYESSALGTTGSSSGGNSQAFLDEAVYRPKSVTTIEQLLAFTSFGIEFENLSQKARDQIVDQLIAKAKSVKVKELYATLKGAGISQPKMDPRLNQEITSLYQIGNDDETTNLQAALVYNVVSGFTGPGVITIEGCDYHDNTQTTGDDKDMEIGVAIGRAVASAAILNKPLFFQVITDGGVEPNSSNEYERVWVSDQNEHSMSVIGYFDPNGQVKQRSLQLGHYTNNGTVDQTTLVGDGPEKMAQATLVNYLAIQGKVGLIEKMGLRLDEKEIDQLTMFG